MKLFIDDERLPPRDNEWWHIVENSTDAIEWLEETRSFGENVEFISFDHDLGGDDTSRPVVNWIIENNYFPDHCTIHSQNPVGRDWLEGTIERYFPKGCLIK